MSSHSRPRRSSSCPTRWRASASTASPSQSSIALVDDVAVGDYVMLHVGYALAKIDEDEARRTLALLREAACSERVA